MSRLPSLPYLIPNQTPYTSFYVMTPQVAADVAHQISTYGFSFTQFWNTDPTKAVISLRFYPVNMYDLLNEQPNLSNVWVAGQDTQVTTGLRIGSGQNKDMRVKFIDFGKVSISRHFNDFRDFNPYTKAMLYVPFFGWQTLPLDIIYNYAYLGLTMAIDFVTGYANIYALALNTLSDMVLIAEAGKKIGIDIPVSTNNSGKEYQEMVANIASGALSTVGGIIGGATVGGVGGAVAGGLTAGLSSAAKTVADYDIQYAMSGSFGSFAALYDPMTAFVKFERATDDPQLSASVVGRPLNQVKTLSSLTGFTQVSDVNVSLTGQMTQTEANEIESLLKSGVIL